MPKREREPNLNQIMARPRKTPPTIYTPKQEPTTITHLLPEPEQFLDSLFEISMQHDGLSKIDAIILYCEQHDIDDPGDLKGLIRRCPELTQDLQREGLG